MNIMSFLDLKSLWPRKINLKNLGHRVLWSRKHIECKLGHLWTISKNNLSRYLKKKNYKEVKFEGLNSLLIKIEMR
ncbi:Protein CBG26076 [Caenorhabditis briggsae]|uniref:Protein CBG26076 n=1 Tax=Caenorhabditis briggsae TaxID=6238 RepID=B6ILQ9_CAEBR|nr:Protein CBG26076 [Caenorhabditis briggsae]CAS00839.1 Protein CBG26076 [Caenorhabditis briggsae]